MISIDLEKNPEFRERLKELGFVKKQESFVKETGDVVHGFTFCFASRIEKRTRYYHVNYSIAFPEAEKMAKAMGHEGLYGAYGSVCRLVPYRKFFWQKPQYNRWLDWRICATDSEQYLSGVINDIIHKLKKYAIPYLDKFTTMRAFIDALEQEQLRFMNTGYDRCLPPLLYRLLGEDDKAKEYIKKILEFYASDEYNKECGTTKVIERPDYTETVYRSPNYNLPRYQEFAKKFLNF